MGQIHKMNYREFLKELEKLEKNKPNKIELTSNPKTKQLNMDLFQKTNSSCTPDHPTFPPQVFHPAATPPAPRPHPHPALTLMTHIII